jgi:restriction system protein
MINLFSRESLLDFKPGDEVLTYNPSDREYHLGIIEGNYSYSTTTIPDFPHQRNVRWTGKVERDLLSISAKNSLGAIQTLFRVPEEVAEELLAIVRGDKCKPLPEEEDTDETSEYDEIRRNLESQSQEFIKDRIKGLDWEEMQEFVAGLLRALGYKTRVVPPGPDRGYDILASPDGLGLEEPIIRVQVKHRSDAIGAPELRSFIGALRQGDKGLYVSVGGYTREARYEADRASIPVTLLELSDLGSLYVENYKKIDSATRALIPLVQVYWPA